MTFVRVLLRYKALAVIAVLGLVIWLAGPDHAAELAIDVFIGAVAFVLLRESLADVRSVRSGRLVQLLTFVAWTSFAIAVLGLVRFLGRDGHDAMYEIGRGGAFWSFVIAVVWRRWPKSPSPTPVAPAVDVHPNTAS